MNKRTDLALENVEMQPKKRTDGVRSLSQTQNGVRISAVTIFNEAGSQSLGKPQGTYETLELPDRLETAKTRAAAQTLLAQPPLLSPPQTAEREQKPPPLPFGGIYHLFRARFPSSVILLPRFGASGGSILSLFLGKEKE